MKTFREFILEKNRHGIPNKEYKQWIKDREKGIGTKRKTFNGIEYVIRNKARRGEPSRYAISPVESRNRSRDKRTKAEYETQLSKDKLLDATGGDEELANLAMDTEESGIRRVKKRAQRIQNKTGDRYSLGHLQPLQPKDPSTEDPGHTLSNVQVEPFSPNASKQNRRPKPGEPGYGLTRTQATQDAISRGRKLGQNIDDIIQSIRSGKPSRKANLLAYLRRPRPKDTGAAKRMAAAYDRKVDRLVNP
jgi:hypothetical protein